MYEFIERRGGDTVFKWGYGVLATLLIVILVIYCVSACRHSFEGEQLTLSSVSSDTVVMVDRSGQKVRLRGSSAKLLNGSANIVTYKNRTIQHAVDWGQTGGFIYTFSDGSTMLRPLMTPNYGDEAYFLAELTQLQREEYGLIKKLETYLRDGSPTWRRFGLGIVALIAMLLGMWMLCFPEKLWVRQMRFLVEGGEPTEWAIFCNRTAGLMIVVLSLVIAFL